MGKEAEAEVSLEDVSVQGTVLGSEKTAGPEDAREERERHLSRGRARDVTVDVETAEEPGALPPSAV